MVQFPFTLSNGQVIESENAAISYLMYLEELIEYEKELLKVIEKSATSPRLEAMQTMVSNLNYHIMWTDEEDYHDFVSMWDEEDLPY